MTFQSSAIRQAILQHLDKGMKEKQEIINKVVEELAVPRPTVRRVARDLSDELIEKGTILKKEG